MSGRDAEAGIAKRWGLEPLVRALEGEALVQAAAVVGSRASGYERAGSDIDLFVYVGEAGDEALAMRRRLASSLADPSAACVIQQTGHSYADVWALLGSSVYLDLMFWTTRWAEDEIDWRVVRHARQMGGVSTAFWRSIRDGQPIFDRSGWLARLRARADVPYPEELRALVVRENLDLLGRSNPFSFLNQAERVIAQGDVVAAQHRTAKWIEAYFDLLFGANGVLHPGEKRLVLFAERECREVPAGLADGMTRLVSLAAACSADTGRQMDRMLEELLAVIGRLDGR